MISQQKQLEEEKRKLWMDIYVAYVSAANAVDPDGASKWADKAVERFTERFITEKKKV